MPARNASVSLLLTRNTSGEFGSVSWRRRMMAEASEIIADFRLPIGNLAFGFWPLVLEKHYEEEIRPKAKGRRTNWKWAMVNRQLPLSKPLPISRPPRDASHVIS